MKDYTRARITINQASKLTYQERQKLATWLKRSATFLTSKEVTRDGLSNRVTFRYIEDQK